MPAGDWIENPEKEATLLRAGRSLGASSRHPSHFMTKQEILEFSGKSVYQIWLEVAIAHFVSSSAQVSFAKADHFVSELMKRELKPEWKQKKS